MITNYTELKAAVSNYLNRDDLESEVPMFIALAEAQFNRVIRTNEMIARVTAQADKQYLEFPPFFLEALNLQLNANPPHRLKYESPENLDFIRERVFYGRAGLPRHFTIVGQTIELCPTPDQVKDIEIAYFKKIPSLTDQAPTNWLLSSHPDVYLYGALTQSAPFLREDARIQVWNSLAERAINELRVANDRQRHNGSTMKARARAYR